MSSNNSMNLYKGKLVIEIVAAVKTSDEKTMTDQVHEGFKPELTNEIMALLGAKGYISQSFGVALENQGVAYDAELELIEKETQKSIIRAESVYNKANRITIKID